MFSNSWFLSLLLSLFLLSCQQSRTVENKNEKGLVIERYIVAKVKDEEKKDGLYERFDEQGRLAEQSTYKMGKLEGNRKLYEQGLLESEETRVADEFQGPYKAYHPNGNLRMEANYAHDVMTGDVKVYYPTGKLKEIVRFANNVEDGPFTEFYENGKLKAEGQYKQMVGAQHDEMNGPVEDGELKLYDTTGTLRSVMDCINGKCYTKWAKDTTSLH